MGLRRGLFTLLDHEFTGKDLILIFGGLFLLGKASWEIHHKVGHARRSESGEIIPHVASLKAVLVQVLFIDVVFSLDSVITAVGMTDNLPHPIPIMVTAIILSVLGMLWFSRAIVTFIEKHPAIKILALSFLLLIGSLLVAEGFHHEIPKGYVYFAMAFAFGVELLQMVTDEKKHSEAPPSQY